MNKTIFLFVLCFFFFQTIILAQIAKRELLPEGNLFLDPGNYSPIDAANKARVYGGLSLSSGNEKFKDGTDLDTDITALAGGADIPSENSIISVGLQLFNSTQNDTFGGVNFEQEGNLSKIAGKYTGFFNDTTILTGEFQIVSDEETITASSGFLSASSSADLQYFDLILGGSMNLGENLAMGAFISPAVSDKADFGGAFTGLELRGGHGLLFGLGLGFNRENYALGIDFIGENEEVDALSAASTALVLSGEILLTGDISLGGIFITASDEELKDGGNFLSPETDRTVIRIFGKRKVNKFTVQVFFQKLSEEGKDFGNATADADRFDTLDLTTIGGVLVADF